MAAPLDKEPNSKGSFLLTGGVTLLSLSAAGKTVEFFVNKQFDDLVLAVALLGLTFVSFGIGSYFYGER